MLAENQKLSPTQKEAVLYVTTKVRIVNVRSYSEKIAYLVG